jgi:hypothetical protein
MWARADELGRARPWFERAARLGDPDAEGFLAHLDRLDGQNA